MKWGVDMLDALQYICIELIVSPFATANVKSIIGYDSGIISDTWNGGKERDKMEKHYSGENLVRISDDKYDCYVGGVGYHVHRYVYASMRPYSY